MSRIASTAEGDAALGELAASRDVDILREAGFEHRAEIKAALRQSLDAHLERTGVSGIGYMV